MNKEKQQKLKELSEKYFWEQKATEICLFILIVVGIIVAFHISGSIMLMFSPEGICTVDSDTGLNIDCRDNILLMGLMGLLLFAVIGLLLFGIGGGLWVGIRAWIENNKEKASNKAKKELGIKDRWDY